MFGMRVFWQGALLRGSKGLFAASTSAQGCCFCSMNSRSVLCLPFSFFFHA